MARDQRERSAGYRLVYENYLAKGLIEPNVYRMRVTEYHLLESTHVFVAARDGKVICTVSLIGDGELGLPMESIYADEVNAARHNGLHIGEVSCLAFRDVEFRKFLPTLIDLTRVLVQYSRAIGIQQLMVTAHPRHARFYERFMGFRQIGERRLYPEVQNAPAVACVLDYEQIDREHPPCYDNCFGVSVPDSSFESVPMTPSEADAYAHVIECSHDDACAASPL